MQLWLCNRISVVASLVMLWWVLSGDVTTMQVVFINKLSF